ncbi:MAG: ferritin [Opitutales bacterium]|nr:ferritin [Opitutales bacterium]
MNKKVIDALHSQIEKERDAAITYEALAIWCSANEYPGFAAFFKKQVAEEREHTEKLIQHLLDLGEMPVLGATKAPHSNYKDLLEVAKAALAHEKSNTAGVLATYEVALAEKDYASKIMLEWFITEQVEEEVWANKMVTLVSRASSSNALYNLDRNIINDLAD